MAKSWVIYENFEKEVTEAIVKYNPYRKVPDHILEHKWATDDEYEEWVK